MQISVPPAIEIIQTAKKLPTSGHRSSGRTKPSKTQMIALSNRYQSLKSLAESYIKAFKDGPNAFWFTVDNHN
ncbi:hypothetical protein H6F43_04225 [Leptolyngbya sp. FACHB-36]|uniref:hypothetical protein n=1 Tax=Leptolyngbya sp. FACHB-36 TaxID=2692808 RepID=UPI00168141B0|nr:hypothetical protein [Leptolyngbya sp. FACHB-36]MBD2019390.1 hypothetical protein [Leptolyngbya sp. FACHB-36]